MDFLKPLGDFFGPIGNVFHVLFYLPVYNVLMVIYEGINQVFPAGAFALAIIILTLIIRSALIPLTRKQLSSTRKMQMIQPQLKALQQQYRGDPQTLMAEQRRLYKENGVSMYGGCLPLLVQMPFLYALYYSFFAVLSNRENLSYAKHLAVINNDLYPFVPHLTALPSTQFLWTNLATPDPWHILPVIAALLTFIQMRMALPVRKPRQPGENPDPTSQAMGTTQYIMPLITLFFGWTFPAGLALYWCISTGFSAVQQYFINGNFGSLFVGIPRMEHLVPPPKDLTPTTTRQPIEASRGPGRALGAGATAAAAAAPSEGGFRGLWSRLRESASAAQTQALERAEQARREREEAAAQAQQQRAAERDGTTGRSAPPRRQRPARQGPVLVRPPQPQTPSQPAEPSAPAGEGESGAAEAAEAPRKASNKSVAPERAIANGTSGKNGAQNGSGTVAARSTNGANGASKPGGTTNKAGGASGTRSTTSGSGAGRKSSTKGGSGSQSRSGRSKRGR